MPKKDIFFDKSSKRLQQRDYVSEQENAQNQDAASVRKDFTAPVTEPTAAPATPRPSRDMFPPGLAGEAAYAKAIREWQMTMSKPRAMPSPAAPAPTPLADMTMQMHGLSPQMQQQAPSGINPIALYLLMNQMMGQG